MVGNNGNHTYGPQAGRLGQQARFTTQATANLCNSLLFYMILAIKY